MKKKRFYNSKNLLADIKAPGGVSEGSASGAMEELLKVPGLTLTLPPELQDLCPDMTPQLVLSYDHEEQVCFSMS